MIQVLENRQKNRWLMLKTVYDRTHGLSNRAVNRWDVGSSFGWDRDEIEAICQYLLGEGLLKTMAIGGATAITHLGIKEVEAAMERPDERTLHFLPSITNINNTIYNQSNVGIGNVTNGEFTGNTIAGTINESINPSFTSAASEIRELITDLEKTYPATTTIEQMVIATEAIKCIEANPAWKQRIINALKEGSMAAFEKAVDRPIGAFIKGAFEGWRDAR